MVLGTHCPVRGGLLDALARARALGCRAMQMFPFPRHHEPGAAELAAFRAAREASGVERLLVHARYVPFLGSSDEDKRRRSAELLRKELALARGLGADAYVLHAGAFSPGSDFASGSAWAAEGIARAMDPAGAGQGPEVEVLLENVPGGGRRMGGPLEELAAVADLAGSLGVKVGFCLDTAHAWAQGYDISGMEGMWRFLGAVRRLLGLERVKAFHLNDTRALLGSHQESHWHAGRGHIGGEGIRALLERPEFEAAPGIVEAPPGTEAENLALVRKLL